MTRLPAKSARLCSKIQGLLCACSSLGLVHLFLLFLSISQNDIACVAPVAASVVAVALSCLSFACSLFPLTDVHCARGRYPGGGGPSRLGIALRFWPWYSGHRTKRISTHLPWVLYLRIYIHIGTSLLWGNLPACNRAFVIDSQAHAPRRTSKT